MTAEYSQKTEHQATYSATIDTEMILIYFSNRVHRLNLHTILQQNWQGKRWLARASIMLGLFLSTGIAAAGDVDRVADCVAAFDARSAPSRNSENRVDGAKGTSSDNQKPSRTSASTYNLARTKKTDSRASRDGAASFEPMLQNCFDLE